MNPLSRPFIRTEHHPFKVCSDFSCPYCITSIAKFKVKKSLTDHFFGDSPAPFVGRFGYPNVNVGVLSPPNVHEDAWQFDAPRFWAQQQMGISDVVNFRASLVNSAGKSHVKSSNKILQLSQEVGMAAKPVEMELKLKHVPILRMRTDISAAPVGSSASIKFARITANPKIPAKIEKVVGDTDLKTSDAFSYLYKAGFDEYQLSKLMSVAAVGVKPDRKLVPTRWSITATDDTIGKQLIQSIKDFTITNDFEFYFGGHLGNYFAILVMPDVWGYELFEMLQGSSDFTTDHELYEGRKSYVEQTAGGYYASRLPILQHLKERKRQATVIALRVITSEYTVPLGVWVVREAVRKALQLQPLKFATREMLVEYATTFLRSKFNHDAASVLSQSVLMRTAKKQQKLTHFFNQTLSSV